MPLKQEAIHSVQVYQEVTGSAPPQSLERSALVVPHPGVNCSLHEGLDQVLFSFADTGHVANLGGWLYGHSSSFLLRRGTVPVNFCSVLLGLLCVNLPLLTVLGTQVLAPDDQQVLGVSLLGGLGEVKRAGDNSLSVQR